ncbi:hypothetical protein [Dysgonomonas sp. HGC4]|uniref:hypothetical protein n=1 Tax=Dysgonomonas sp. HGC4 TaxID=1658009 RepID=UPI000682157A|nr:hypothetical protein [Dysgonomonas sp. HGC4]MBD8347753.1 hypothetical protein [Dysgonomonas sp. HGC4]
MKQTAEKNKKQRSSYLPISIGWVLKIVLIIVGYSLWGAGFIWALVGLYLFYDVLRGILSCLLILGAIIALIIIIKTCL